MKKQISFIAQRTQLRPFIKGSSFEFSRDKGFIYIQKLCFWFLAKIKAYHTDYHETVETFTIDAESFMDKLFAQKDFIEAEFNIIPSKMYIGASDYHKLMGELNKNQYLNFNAEYYYCSEEGRPKIFGLEIYVIPWMEGILLVKE